MRRVANQGLQMGLLCPGYEDWNKDYHGNGYVEDVPERESDCDAAVNHAYDVYRKSTRTTRLRRYLGFGVKQIRAAA
jgi:hypothetical protein